MTMYVEGETPDDPTFIVYAQVRRVLESRYLGQGAAEAMAGLMALIEPWKDDKYFEDLRTQNDGNPEDLVWGTFEAVIRLLARRHMWPKPPREVKPGEELLEAL